MTLSENGFQFIRSHESFRAKMYFDAAGKPTIGYGTLIDTPEEQYLKTATISVVQAEQLLRRDVKIFEGYVNQYVQVALTQSQFDALVSLTYNIGPGNLLKSNVLKLVNQSPNDPAIRAAFAKWNTAGGKVLAGLTKRRREEADLYFGGTFQPTGPANLLETVPKP